MSQTKFTNVRTANAFNSTEFTTCCDLAVLRDDTKCPRCEATVLRYGRPRSNNCLMCGKPRNVCHC